MEGRRSAFQIGCIAAIALGVALRLLSPFLMELWSDGQAYAAMGRALADTGSLRMPLGDVATWRAEPGWSHHFPPLYPAYLAAWYPLAGFGLAATQAAAVVMAFAALAGCWLVFRDLLGRDAALLGTAILALDPQLLWVTGTGFSENLVVLLFALTLWAILKSLDHEPAIVLAGLFAGLAYLTRASLGALFVIAGLAGLAWRFHYVRWAVFRNRPYLAAIGLFGLLVGAWALRNLAHFDWPHWQTSVYVEGIQACIRLDILGSCQLGGGPAFERFLLALLVKAPMFGVFLGIWALPFWPELRRSLARVREQRESAAWLAVGLVFLLGWVMAAMFWAAEDNALWWPDNRRYVVIAAVPFLLAALRHADFRSKGFQRRAGALLVVLAVLSLAVFALPVRFPENAAAREVGAMLAPGEAVALHGNVTKYGFYAYLGRADAAVCDFRAFLWEPATCQPRFLLSASPGFEACYEANGFARRAELDQRQRYLLPGWGPRQVTVWERVEAREPDASRCFS